MSESKMNSFRPRTQQFNPTFQCISSLEEFTQIDNSAFSDSSLNHSYHPHHYPLHPKLAENNSQSPSKRNGSDAIQKPQQKIESHILLKPMFDNNIQIQGYSYAKLYQDHILPRDEDLELREEDLAFLKELNQENQRISPRKIEITEDLLKQFFIHFEKKSTRQTTATKEESIIDMSAELKDSIEPADLEQLYQYWRKERENDKYLRQGELHTQKEIYPFMRKYWRANSEEQSYHSTFRPREYFRKKTRKSTRTDNKEIQDKLIGLEGDLQKCKFIALKIKKRELLKRELAYQNIVEFSTSVPGLQKEFKIFNTFSSRAADIAEIQMQISPKLHKRKKPKVKHTKDVNNSGNNGVIFSLTINNDLSKEQIKPDNLEDIIDVKAERNRNRKQNYLGNDDLSKPQSIDETKASSEIRDEENKQKVSIKQKKGQEVDSLSKIPALQPKQEENKELDLNLVSDLVEKNENLMNETINNNNNSSKKNNNTKKRQKKTEQQGQPKDKKEGVITDQTIPVVQKKEEIENPMQQVDSKEENNKTSENIIFEKPKRDISRQQIPKQVLKLNQPDKNIQIETLKLETEQETAQLLSSFLIHFSSLGIPISVDNVQDWEKIQTKSQAILEDQQQKLKNPNTFAYLIRQRVGRAGRVLLDRVCDNPIDVAGIQSGKISYFIEPETKRIIYNTFSYPNPEAIRFSGQQSSKEQKKESILAQTTTLIANTVNSTQLINNIQTPKIKEEEKKLMFFHSDQEGDKMEYDLKEKELSGGVTVSDRLKQKERDIYRNCVAFSSRNEKILSLMKKQQQQEIFPGKSRLFPSKKRLNQRKNYQQRFTETDEDSDTSLQSTQLGNNLFQNLRQKMQQKVKEREKQKQLQIQREKAEQQRLAKLKIQNELKNNAVEAELQNQNDISFIKQSDNLSNPFTYPPLQQRQNSIDLMTQMINEQQPIDNQFTQSDTFYPNNQFNPYNNHNSLFHQESAVLQGFNAENHPEFNGNQLNPQESNNNFHNLDHPHNNNIIDNVYQQNNLIMQSPSQQQLFSPNHNGIIYPYEHNFLNNNTRDLNTNNNNINNPYEQLTLNNPIANHLENHNIYQNNEYFTDFDNNNRRNINNINNNPVESTTNNNNIPYVQESTYNNQQFDGGMVAEQNYLNCSEQDNNDQYLDEIDQVRNINQDDDDF